jgi:hypothetical protein
MMKNNKPGYVLVMTLLMLSILVIVVSRLFYKASAYSGFSTTIIESQKAKQLALSGIQLAISRMSIPPLEVDKNDDEEKVEKALEEKFLLRVFPIINLWQEYKFTEEKDSFDGSVRFVVACENGKMNINKIYLVNQYFIKKKQGGVDPSKSNLEGLANFTSGLKNFVSEDYLSGLQEDFNEMKYPYNDVSELLKIPQFDNYFKNKLFLDYPLADEEGQKKIFLMDLFTVFTESLQLQPFLLSHSVIQMLGLKLSDDSTERKEALEEALKSEPPPEGTKKEEQLKAEWNNLYRPIFGTEFEELPPNASAFLNPSLMPTYFSVVSSAKVGRVTKKLYAILQLRIIGDSELSFDVIKLYWIS